MIVAYRQHLNVNVQRLPIFTSKIKCIPSRLLNRMMNRYSLFLIVYILHISYLSICIVSYLYPSLYLLISLISYFSIDKHATSSFFFLVVPKSFILLTFLCFCKQQQDYITTVLHFLCNTRLYVCIISVQEMCSPI